MKGYNPRPHVAEMLNHALATIKALPYRPSSRYVFYRLVQERGLGKADYKDRFLKWTSRARKTLAPRADKP